MKTIVIPGKFPTLNELIDANRQNRHSGNKLKQESQRRIVDVLVLSDLGQQDRPIKLHYRYYEPKANRDMDNVSGFFHKVFQDALVAVGYIPNDNWRYIKGFTDDFYLDRENPRIEITIERITE